MCSLSSDLLFLKDWNERIPYLDSEFRFCEPVLALRCSVLHSLMCRVRGEGGRVGNLPVESRRRVEHLFIALTDSLLTLARSAREAGRYQVGGHCCRRWAYIMWGGLMILGNMSGLSRYNTTGIVLCRPVQITLLPNLPLFHTKRS